MQLELLNHGGLSRQFLFHLLHHVGLLRLARVAVFDLDLKQIDLLQRLGELMLQGADLGLLNLDRLRLLALFLEYLLEAFNLGQLFVTFLLLLFSVGQSLRLGKEAQMRRTIRLLLLFGRNDVLNSIAELALVGEVRLRLGLRLDSPRGVGEDVLFLFLLFLRLLGGFFALDFELLIQLSKFFLFLRQVVKFVH